MKKYKLYKKHSLITFILVNLLFCVFANAENQCASFFTIKTSSTSGVQELIDNGSDFIMMDFIGQAMPLRSTGCGPVCAINAVEAARWQLGLQGKSSAELSETLYQLTKSQLTSTGFGYHATQTFKGLNVGSLAKLIEKLLKAEPSLVDSDIKSFYVDLGRNDLAHEGNIQFVKTFDATAFSVSASTSKIVLVSVNDKNRLSSGNSFLTAHFYNVLSYKDGVVTLHDPNIKGSQIQFKAIRDTDPSIGITTFKLEPLTPNYTIDPRFPRDLLYVVSGYVSLDVQ